MTPAEQLAATIARVAARTWGGLWKCEPLSEPNENLPQPNLGQVKT
jgi:hypothetical protein